MSSCAKKGSWFEGVKRKQKAKAEVKVGKKRKGKKRLAVGPLKKQKRCVTVQRS
jgi:hypothetical protein